MPRPIVAPEVGERFGRLTVTGTLLKPRSDGRRRTAVAVRCDCGTEKEVWAFNLFSGNTKSCGCLHRERAAEANTTHGDKKAKARLYRIWRGMNERCSNPNAVNYRWYGAKGVSVEWEGYEAFRDWAQANGYEDGLQIDREDSGGNYAPGNCRWVTQSENLKRRGAAFPAEVDIALAEFCDQYGRSRMSVIEEAVTGFLHSAGKGVSGHGD